MLSEKNERKLQEFESEDLIMDAHLPEGIKSALLAVLHDQRIAASLTLEGQLPDLSGTGMLVKTIEFDMEPITQEVRDILEEKGFTMPDDVKEPEKCYLHFVSKSEEVLFMLSQAFEKKNFDLIQKITHGLIYPVH